MKNLSKVKTREQIANELGISRKTFYNWLKKEEITLGRGLITPKEQQIIYEKFGIDIVNVSS